MIDVVNSILSSVIFVCICMLFVSCFAVYRHRLYQLRYLYFVIWTFLIFSISLLSSRQLYIRILFVSVCSAVFLKVLYELKILNAVMMSLIYYGICCASDFFVYIIYKNVIYEYNLYNAHSSVLTMLLGMLSQLIVLLVVLIVSGIKGNPVFGLLSRKDWAKLSVFPTFSIIATSAMVYNFSNLNTESQNVTLMFISFGLLVLNFFVLIIIRDIVKREVQIRDARLMAERASGTAQLYYDRAKSYDDQKKKEHEFRNHLVVINDLLLRRNNEKAMDYIRELTDRSDENTDVIDTNHPIVNAIINTKYKEALEKDIYMVFDVCDMSDISISDREITVIISNLLNNALEASEKKLSEDAFIKLMMRKENNSLFISVINSYLGSVILSNGVYHSTKEDASGHGFGLKNITDIVNKYHGDCVIRSDNGQFKVIISIPL